MEFYGYQQEEYLDDSLESEEDLELCSIYEGVESEL